MVEEARARGQALLAPAPGTRIAVSFVWRARDESLPRVQPLLDALREVWGGG